MKPVIVSVDDEVNILKLIASVLQKDFDVTTFSDSQKAIEALTSSAKPELIICDINMPGLDGYELHEQVRALPSLRGVPFIYLTALDTRDDFRKGMLQGADDYLTKPFTPGELKEAVTTRLTRSQSLRRPDEVLTIRSLGGASLAVGDEAVQYEAKNVVELLLYLLVKGGAARLSSVRRDLWHKNVSENTVHVLINRARKAFQDAAQFVFEEDSINLRLVKPYSWDAQAFSEAAEAALTSKAYADVEKAVGLFHGDFLPNFTAPWTEQQRARYDSLYFQLLELSAEVAPNEASRQAAARRLETFLG